MLFNIQKNQTTNDNTPNTHKTILSLPTGLLSVSTSSHPPFSDMKKYIKLPKIYKMQSPKNKIRYVII